MFQKCLSKTSQSVPHSKTADHMILVQVTLGANVQLVKSVLFQAALNAG